jgi:HemY protein
MRIVLALLVLGAAVIGGAFFAGHPGQVEITWQGWQIETSVGVLVAVTALLALIVSLLVLMIAGLRRLPSRLRRRRSERRRGAGEAALTRGLVALAASRAQ